MKCEMKMKTKWEVERLREKDAKEVLKMWDELKREEQGWRNPCVSMKKPIIILRWSIMMPFPTATITNFISSCKYVKIAGSAISPFFSYLNDNSEENHWAILDEYAPNFISIFFSFALILLLYESFPLLSTFHRYAYISIRHRLSVRLGWWVFPHSIVPFFFARFFLFI